jgi:hypothetical protein
MSAHVLPPLAVNNKSERKVNLLPPLGFEPVISGVLVHFSNHSAKSHPVIASYFREVDKFFPTLARLARS